VGQIGSEWRPEIMGSENTPDDTGNNMNDEQEQSREERAFTSIARGCASPRSPGPPGPWPSAIRQCAAGWATGTPKGRDGFARDFELASRPSHTLFRASTWTNAHNLPPGYIGELGYSGAFARQEIDGLFVAFEGLVYTLDASAGGHLAAPPERERWQCVVGGVDWGYTNPAAAVVFALDGDARVWQLDECYQRRAGLQETLLPALLALTRRYGVET
jgi:hypothetical protein